MMAFILTYDWLHTSGAIFLLIRNAIAFSFVFNVIIVNLFMLPDIVLGLGAGFLF